MLNRAEITVLRPGLATSIQDLGRYGYRNIGMPVSGAMDSYSFKQANYLIGNSCDTACLEVTLTGPTLQFNRACSIAITGADMKPTLNGQPIPLGETIKVPAHGILQLYNCAHGCRSYIAVTGGFAIKSQMGSLSTYARARIGGVHGSVLAVGDTIPYSVDCLTMTKRILPRRILFHATTHYRIRVLRGPEFTSLVGASLDCLQTGNYTVSTDLDRMGCRLRGPELHHEGHADIISAPVQFGTIQLPANCQPIILLADAQTTGGYARIANVASIDLPILGQLRPGNTVTFELIDLDFAQELYRIQNQFYSIYSHF